MPSYEYRCNKCMTFIEVERSYQERETDVICPQCNLKTSRIYHAPGIQFKGTGFYKTGG
jgi:putative FmdB family regulatory protein